MNEMNLTRRSILGGFGCACCMGMVGAAQARVTPAEVDPMIGPGHRPTDKDEQGMWQLYERAERDIADSNLLIKDPGLTRYLGGLAEKVGGPTAKDMRVYLAHIPEFNAFMAPTGFMVVFTGLLTRMRDEAQLAGVIGHEAGHFLRRHHIRGWRDTKRKSDILTVLSMGAGLGGAATGAYLGDWVRLAGMGTIFSLAAYSRHMEAEADALGLKQIARAGYDPNAMPETWEQLIGEMRATARMRRKLPRREGSLLATHPAPQSRMTDLRISAQEVRGLGTGADRGKDRYIRALGAHRKTLLEDQVKLNDPGGSLYILNSLAADGWNGLLRFYEGEVWRLRGEKGDNQRAAEAYAAAIAYPDAPPDAWRSHGYALIKMGRGDEGRRALQRYLAMAPNAPDAPMVRQTVGL
ncbi:MAG TPA: M48 family metalloprotease [Allosphingosinicella sp.]|uniref:M48 family metallopeptidase n=1 Tax=Allosphingosinicella sp. TaxID=2823234 RepID=UPI002EDBA971